MTEKPLGSVSGIISPILSFLRKGLARFLSDLRTGIFNIFFRYSLIYQGAADYWRRDLALNDSTTQLIADLNDQCRAGNGGRLVQTAGIDALSSADKSAIHEKVRSFENFTDDNDLNGKREFGTFWYRGGRIFWKIDYYARDMANESENPADPEKTIRILTIMLAKEFKKFDTWQKRQTLVTPLATA